MKLVGAAVGCVDWAVRPRLDWVYDGLAVGRGARCFVWRIVRARPHRAATSLYVCLGARRCGGRHRVAVVAVRERRKLRLGGIAVCCSSLILVPLAGAWCCQPAARGVLRSWPSPTGAVLVAAGQARRSVLVSLDRVLAPDGALD